MFYNITENREMNPDEISLFIHDVMDSSPTPAQLREVLNEATVEALPQTLSEAEKMVAAYGEDVMLKLMLDGFVRSGNSPIEYTMTIITMLQEIRSLSKRLGGLQELVDAGTIVLPGSTPFKEDHDDRTDA
jgi:hypothetical protein